MRGPKSTAEDDVWGRTVRPHDMKYMNITWSKSDVVLDSVVKAVCWFEYGFLGHGEAGGGEDWSRKLDSWLLRVVTPISASFFVA